MHARASSPTEASKDGAPANGPQRLHSASDIEANGVRASFRSVNDALTTRTALANAPFTGDEVLRPVMVRFVAVRTLEANIRIGNERVCGLARHSLTTEDGEPLQTGFAFDQPDQRHLFRDLCDRIPTGITTCTEVE